ncbi:putative chemotaxis response regulator receiver (CheY-like) [Syntrophobacter sp. SbD1]|nr:putative chemotaxis response regulator receiver (CheY-like) [Syntrophobacter sp. SbD1]
MSYNVLIVDDSKSMRKVMLKTLQLSGFELGECLEASNGQEALDILDGRWIDLILSDVHMPVMDGIGFIRSLREQDICRDTPVVFVTTEANQDRLKQLMDLGASGYIRKPFRPEDIRALLNRIMGETNGFRMGTDVEGCDF